MKKIVELILFIGIIATIVLYASLGYAWYVVVNPDKTIHTIEEKPFEKLINGRERFEIDSIPTGDVSEYLYKSGNFVKKPSKDINEEKAEKKKKEDIYEMINAAIQLNAIEKLEEMDTLDTTTDYNSKHIQIINDRKGD